MDIVILYVNSNDTDWVEERKKYVVDTKENACRFRDNNELKFLLRSIDKYAPWIENVFIVSNSKMPDWLDTGNEKLHIIRHEDIMPREMLPCYNSQVIESNICNIPGLSDVFIYTNDDMFFGRAVSKDFFEKDGIPVVRMIGAKVDPNKGRGYTVLTAQKLIEQKYGRHLELIPTHGIDVYSKEYMKKCKEEFAAEYEEVRFNRFRKENDISRVLFHYYMIINDACILKAYKRSSSLGFRLLNTVKKLILPSKYNDYVVDSMEKFFASPIEKLLLWRGPKMLCLNDSEGTTEEQLDQYAALMNKKYKRKSRYEK